MVSIIIWFVCSAVWFNLCLSTESYTLLRFISILVFLLSLIIEMFWVAKYVINSPDLLSFLLP
jgi:hypothetical protein